MSRPATIPVEEQLEDVEKMIVTMRWARNDPAIPEHRMLQTLKCVAAELRERKKMSIVAGLLQHRIDAVERARTGEGGFGFADSKPLVGLAQEVLGRWPTIRRALELLAEDQLAESRMPPMTDRPF